MFSFFGHLKRVPSSLVAPDIDEKWPWLSKDLQNDTLRYAVGVPPVPLTQDEVNSCFTAAFARWKSDAQLAMNFLQVNDGTHHLYITWGALSGGGEGAVAQTDFPPQQGDQSTVKSMTFNNDKSIVWVIGASSGQFDFPSIALHEVGHALGLGHGSGSKIVMCDCIGPGPRDNYQSLFQDDADAMQDLYALHSFLGRVRRIFKRLRRFRSRRLRAKVERAQGEKGKGKHRALGGSIICFNRHKDLQEKNRGRTEFPEPQREVSREPS
jgi:hypothetical protein